MTGRPEHRQRVARDLGGEAALRADRQVLDRHQPGRLVDPADELVTVLDRTGLGG